MPTVEQVSENVWIKIVYRYGTPALLALVLYLGNQYVTTIQATLEILTASATKLELRVSALETSYTILSPIRDEFQRTAISKIDRLDGQVSALTALVSGLSGQLSAQINGMQKPEAPH